MNVGCSSDSSDVILNDVSDFRFGQVCSVGALLNSAKQAHMLGAELEKFFWWNNHKFPDLLASEQNVIY